MPRWLQYCGAPMRTRVFVCEWGDVGVHTRHISQHLLRYGKHMPRGERDGVCIQAEMSNPVDA